MLDVKRLRVLREVALKGSFSAAAESLSFTQSAVSQQVAALEREAGTRLVERGARGIRLTEAGTALVSHAEAVIARLEDAEEELAAIAGLRGGRLRFGSFPSAGSTLVPHAVAEFRRRHPEVELGMVEGEPEQTLPLLRTGEIDLALTYDYSNLPEAAEQGLDYTEIMRDPVALALPKSHPLAGRARVKVADLREDTWIGSCLADRCRGMVVEVCRKAGFDPEFSFETDDHHTTQAFIAAGVGVCLLPALALAPTHPGVVVRPPSPKAPTRQIQVAVLRDSYRSPAAEAMIEILTEVGARFAPAVKAAA